MRSASESRDVRKGFVFYGNSRYTPRHSEIQDLIYNYSAIVDQKRFDDLPEVFTEDAHIDYSAVGAPVGGRGEIIAFLHKVMLMSYVFNMP